MGMEKQLLFLLDWDLRIRPEDLYCHLEPFLAPIREYQIMEEQARLQRLREKELYQQYHAPAYSSHATESLDAPYESTEELCMHGVESRDGSMLVHIQAPDLHSKAPLSRLQSYEEKPAKKARIGASGGNFFSRLLNSTTSRVGAY